MGAKKKKPPKTKKPDRRSGRPRKERPEEKQEFWKQVLHDHRLGPDRAEQKWLVKGWILGNVQSITQEARELASQLELAANDKVVLSAAWLRFLEYMNVAAEALSPEDNGAALKKSFLEDARSRHQEQPIEIPAEAPSPAEMRALLARGELKVSLEADRRHKIVRIERFANTSEQPEARGKRS